MKQWSAWETTRRQVAVSGYIADADGRPVADAQITLVQHPAAFATRLMGAASDAGRRWDELTQRPDRTKSRPDGLYFFLDLPPGNYALRAVDLRAGQSAEERVVLETDKKQGIKRMSVDFKLSASG